MEFNSKKRGIKGPLLYGKIRIFGRFVKIERIILLISIIAAILFSVFIFLTFGIKRYDILAISLLISFMVATFPYLIYSYFKYSKTAKILDYYPIFLRDLSEAISSGMSLTEALKLVSKNDYGILSDFLKKLYIWVSWGEPFEKAFKKYNEYFEAFPVIQRVNEVFLETYLSGGDVAKILTVLSSDVETLQMLEKERESYLKQQEVILYIIFFIFAGILVAIQYVIEPLLRLQVSMSETGGLFMFSGQAIDLEYIKLLSTIALFIESIFIGLIIGTVTKGKLSAGYKHIVIFLIFSAVVSILFILPAKVTIELYVTPTLAVSGEDIRISGTVSINSKAPGKSLVVEIFSEDFNLSKTTTTDENGNFEVIAKAPEEKGGYVVFARVVVDNKEHVASATFNVV